jgi:F-type H+-transporting ATPase subunit 8
MFYLFTIDITVNSKLNYLLMPQLVPFYYINQLVYGFSTLSIIIVLMTLFILPTILYIIVSRLYITKL